MMGACLNRCGNRRANCGIMRHWGHSLYSSTGQQINFSFDVDWIVNKISLSSMGLVLKQKQSQVFPYIHLESKAQIRGNLKTMHFKFFSKSSVEFIADSCRIICNIFDLLVVVLLFNTSDPFCYIRLFTGSVKLMLLCTMAHGLNGVLYLIHLWKPLLQPSQHRVKA